MTTTETSASFLEILRDSSVAQRKLMLRELVELCFADGSLDSPMRVTQDEDGFAGYVSALFPQTAQPFPEPTAEEEAETQRRLRSQTRSKVLPRQKKKKMRTGSSGNEVFDRM